MPKKSKQIIESVQTLPPSLPQPVAIAEEPQTHEVRFSTDWFLRNIPHWEQVLFPFKGKPNLKFLEIGCFEGRASLWLMQNILTDPSSILTVIDPFTGSWEHKNMEIDLENTFRSNLKPYIEAKRVGIWKATSDNLRLGDRDQLDFIYIDGSHNAIDVLRDGVNAWDLLKKGGVIIFDDYNWGDGLIPSLRPHWAIEACLQVWGSNCEYEQFLDQLVVYKK